MNGTVEIYHAATRPVERPDVKAGRPRLDFGPGFYLTDLYEQAVSWARRRAREQRQRAVINVYHLDQARLYKEARCKIFPAYDEEWLRFVVACRSGEEAWKGYDYVEGGVADDRVINTVTLYMQGILPLTYALERLQYLRPNNQVCLLSQTWLDATLRFTECVELPADGQL